MSLTVAVDFDGVLHRYSRGWNNGEIYDPPVEGAIEALVSLLKRFNVTVFTSREDLKAVALWIDAELKKLQNLSPIAKLQFPVSGPIMSVSDDMEKVVNNDGDWHVALMTPGNVLYAECHKLIVTNRKPIAFVYIDDRAIRFTNWPDVLKYFS